MWVAWTLAGVSIACTGLSLFLLVVPNGGHSPFPAVFATAGEPFTVTMAVPGTALVVIIALLGGLVAARRPANPVGWLLCAGALLGSAFYCTYQYAAAALLSGYATLPLATTAAWLAQWLWVVTMGVLLAIIVIFPDGRLPSPLWRPVSWLVAGAIAALAVLEAFAPGALGEFPVRNPVGVGALDTVRSPVTAVTAFAWPALVATAVASVLARFRRARGHQRQQIKYLMAAALLLPVAVVSYQLRVLPWPIPLIVLLAAFTAVPVAIGLAVLRYRLYDIDRIISRTLAYTLLTGLLAGTYLAGVLAASRLLAPLGAGSELAVAAATLATAAVFTPARRRIQAVVDRRFNRARYNAEQVVVAFREQLRAEVELADVVAATRTAAVRTVEPARASLWLHGEPGSR